MVDFKGSAGKKSVRRSGVGSILRRGLGGSEPAATAGEPLPGTAAEDDGAGAVAAIEAWVSDTAGFSAGFPAALSAGFPTGERFDHRTQHNLDPTGSGLFRRSSAVLRSATPRDALAAAVGAATSGLRAAAFLSGPELLAGQDLLVRAARRRLPLVVHLAERAGAGPADALGSGHEAYHAAASCGALQLFAADVQEAADLALIARRVAEDALTPAVVAMDGPETALAVQDLILPAPEAVRSFLGAPGETVHPPTPSQEMLFGRHRWRVPRWHDAEHPILTGAAMGPEVFALSGAARRAFFDPHLGSRSSRTPTRNTPLSPPPLRHAPRPPEPWSPLAADGPGSRGGEVGGGGRSPARRRPQVGGGRSPSLAAVSGRRPR